MNNNRPIDDTTLDIIAKTFQDNKNIIVLSCYEKDNHVYGFYIHSLHNYLSFVKQPEADITMDIDGYQITFIELGAALYYIYNIGSPSFYNLIIDAVSDNKEFNEIIAFLIDNPPIEKFVGHLQSMIHMLQTTEFQNKDIENTLIEIEGFNKIYQIIDDEIKILNDDYDSIIKLRIYIDNIKSKLDIIKTNKISEKKIAELDIMFTKLCISQNI